MGRKFTTVRERIEGYRVTGNFVKCSICAPTCADGIKNIYCSVRVLVCIVSCGVGSFSERGAHHKRAYISARRTISKSRLAPHPYSVPSTATRLKTPLKNGRISTSGSTRQYQHQHQSRPRQSKPAAPAPRRLPLVPYHWNRCLWRDGTVRNQPGARTSTRFSRREAYHGRRWGTLLVREHCALGCVRRILR